MSRRVFTRTLDRWLAPPDAARAVIGKTRPVLLESSQVGGALGRYSILAWEPAAVFEARETGCTLTAGDEERSLSNNPLIALREALATRAAPESAGEPLPFHGGAIGYFSYDLGRSIERQPEHAENDLPLPLCLLGFYDRAVIFDHFQQRVVLVAQSDGDGADASFDVMTRDLLAPAPATETGDPPLETPISAPDRAGYEQSVRRALGHIRDGDIYQVNLCRRLDGPLHLSPFALYERVRRFTPSRYGAYLDEGDFQIVCASPELFLRRSGANMETRPIKGTRRRTGDPDADAEALADLLSSEKDRAELSMIVDLERNDLGRVCDYGTVKVGDHGYVDELPSVFHTVTTVTGSLRAGTDIVDILRATFPGGSVTGAPKVRAMELIDTYEPVRRGPYTGAIGCVADGGDFSLNMVIRTIIARAGRAYLHIGAGIVADSDPASEYEETRDKARALCRALGWEEP
ncbi:MAG: anthranilate synthase component I family protein [Deltaproteobacteria bacterium]|nr:anthranilate synthase component I family protein [Deltaproteobacteria bacterium]